ncbi:MAG: DMP19 family protein [Phycisphaerae bacterium]
MTLDDQLTEAFDRGLRCGTDALSERERDLYFVQHFIIEFEMGGLTTYLYNQLHDIEKVDRTIAAMQRIGATALADLLANAAELFRTYEPTVTSRTWREILKQHDPEEALETIHNAIEKLPRYGLPEVA